MRKKTWDYFVALFLLLSSCNTFEKKISERENQITSTSKKSVTENNYLELNLDIDSSLFISIPPEWDKYENLKFPSYEYVYYKKIRDDSPRNSIIVKRLKFANPIINLEQLFEYYQNEIFTTPDFKTILEIDRRRKLVSNVEIGTLFYCIENKDPHLFIGKLFYLNPDSSRTIIEVESQLLDTTSSHKIVEDILESVNFKKGINLR